ncbi:cation:proton antiporter [Burkholderiaceae bacterium DAT-1]|nr:cation:proton antiporter [Burkholderiaceae bacterium DAT-1]
MHTLLGSMLILLAAAVAAVILCRRAQLPPLLGYLLIGVIAGPHAAGLIPSGAEAEELGEYGVVFMMFSLGLEFSLPKLVAMKSRVFGVGGAQMLLTAVPAGLIGWACGMHPYGAFLLGATLAMSSTAIVSRMLTEKVELATPHGEYAIGVLLFQDLAVVPLLIITPVLGGNAGDMGPALTWAAFKIVLTLAVLLYLGPRLLRPLLHIVAKQRSNELFVLNVLLVTLGVGWMTSMAGLSMALGAFIAGMLLAETQYRHQVEDDIRPFRDLLLGLFFITVGMRLDVIAGWHAIAWVLGILAALLLLKALAVGLLLRGIGRSPGTAMRTAILLAQGGEFGFVMLAQISEIHILSEHIEQATLAAILLSMIIAPFFIQQSEALVRRFIASDWMLQAMRLTQLAARTMATSNHVIVCGYGRSGQALVRLLEGEEVPWYALDLDPDRVSEASAAGENVAYGDASKLEVLLSAGLSRARALVVTYDDPSSARRVIEVVRTERPDLPVVVRTGDEHGIDQLREAGADEVVAEMMEGSLMLATHTMLLLGVPLNRVLRSVRTVREQRYALFRGFFRGVGDEADTDGDQHPRLHTIMLPPKARGVGMSVTKLASDFPEIELRTLRRQGALLSERGHDLCLEPGDVLVICGESAVIDRFERHLLMGGQVTSTFNGAVGAPD